MQIWWRRKKAIRSYMGKADDDLILLFGDSAEVSLMPTITRCWTKVGAQRVILTPGVRAQKRWDWGAVDVVTGRTVHLTHLRRNNVGFRRLLAAIARTFRLKEHPQRKVVLFVDNDRAHHAKQVRHLLAKYDGRIRIEWLPPYSPELNPQEDIWRHLRRRVTHNHYFEHIDALLDAVEEFHQRLQAEPDQVLRLTSKWTKLLST
jgi:transposase